MSGNTTCSAATYNEQIPLQIPQLQLAIAATVAVTDPFANTITGGTVDNNVGETLRTLTPGRMVTNQSYAAPEFTRFLDGCNPTGATAEFGSTEYQSFLEQLAGRGPDICLTRARSTVLGMYADAEKRLRTGIAELKGQDIANVYSQRSGFKVSLKASATDITDISSGGEWQVDVNYPGYLPDAGINWTVLRSINEWVQENFEVETFGEGANAHSIFIGSADAIEVLRNDTNLKGDFNIAVQGSFKEAKDATFKYQFTDIPYRGMKFAKVTRPKRFNVLDGNGNPVFIEPYVNQVADNGTIRVVNPAWSNASYELGFLCFKNAFKYNVPKQYLGEGSFKFPPQMYGGELMWRNVISDCNPFGDTGYHVYRLVRGIHPVVPHSVIPIAMKRCGNGRFNGTVPCDTVSA